MNAVLRRAVREPFRPRTWAETGYLVAVTPLAVVGFGVMISLLVAGGFAALTFVGLPLIAFGSLVARWFGTVHRALATSLLGERFAAPDPFRPHPGILGWIGSGLTDGAGWRARVYQLVTFPTSIASVILGVSWWVYGIFFLLYPGLRYVNGLSSTDDNGTVHHGGLRVAGFWFDTWPRSLLVSVAGVLVLLAAPWVVRGLVAVDRGLIRFLLGPSGSAQRVQDLERSRTLAVEDSAATLRRIERDLHDGTQARLVALAMNLGMAKESLANGDDVDVARLRTLVDAAHLGAKEAVVELRDLARGIHPPALDRGLDSALATLAARSAVPVRLDTRLNGERPSPAVESIAYFCVAELLTNVARHSGARSAAVDVEFAGGELRVRVADDDGGGGARLLPGSAGGGSGLAGLADRVRTVDGTLDVHSPAGGPTVVEIVLPGTV